MGKSLTGKKSDNLKFPIISGNNQKSDPSGREKTRMGNMVYHTVFNDDAFK